MKYVSVVFAEGFEEVEGLTVVDLLRRADIEVRMTGLDGTEMVTGAHGIQVGMDISLEELDMENVLAIVLPGGMPGTRNLKESKALAEILEKANKMNTHIGAICAAPSVLGSQGILKGKKAVCYPGFEEELEGAFVSRESVVTDGNITTSRGMGTAIDFGLELIERLKGKEEAKRIGASIIYCKE